MLKHLFLTVAILTSVMGFISCSKDEPNNGVKDSIENPTDDPSDDPSDDGTVIVHADGTTSNGMQFRRIDETHFMLNYVKYRIDGGHLDATDHDEIEVLNSLKGKVTIVPAVILDGTKYYTRCVYGFSSSKLKEIDLPNTITSIRASAFANASSLEEIRIPQSVTEIEDLAFLNCTSLSSVELNEDLEILGSSAFSGCTNLERISIPEDVIISEGCFENVPLKELQLPKSFRIGKEGSTQSDKAVFNSKVLKTIYVNSENPITPKGRYSKLFDDLIINEAYLNVPEGTSDLYKKSPFWGKFKHIVEYNPE